MHFSQSYLSTTTAAFFVTCLAAIGLLSHSTAERDTSIFSVVNGSYQSQYETSFIANNPLDRFAAAAFGAIRYAVFGQAQKGAIVGQEGWLFTTEELEQTPEFEQNLLLVADRIAQVEAELRARGVELLPVLVPDKAEIYAEMLGVRRPGKIVQRRKSLLNALSDRGIRTLDATTVLREAKQTQDVFLRSDTHWSPHGSQAVATGVAHEIADAKIQLTPATVTTHQGGKTAFDGDLMAFVPTGTLRHLIGPEQEQITRFTTVIEANGGLFDAPTVDVALVGTSFSARPEWHFAGFLQQALGAELINFALEGQGPFVPMTAFLDSDTFKNAPPKLVIWEIPVRYTSKDMTP